MVLPSPTIIFNNDNYKAHVFQLALLKYVATIYGAFEMDHNFYSSIDERTKKHNKTRFFVWGWYIIFDINDRERTMNILHGLYEYKISAMEPQKQPRTLHQPSNFPPQNQTTIKNNHFILKSR